MIELRDYQQHFITKTHEALRRVRKVCAVAPCGSGKRYMATWWAMKIAEKGRRLLVATNRRILVDQMAGECRANGVECGVIMGSEPRNDKALVQIASIQTLKTREWKDMPEAAWVVIDECHRNESDYTKLFDLHPGSKCVGLTATPVGNQGRSLKGMYDEIIEPVKNSELIQRGLLLKTDVFAPSEPDIEGVTVVDGGEYNQNQLGKAVETCTVFADVFKWWKPYSHMQTVVFSPRVKYAYGLVEQFREQGFKAEIIEGGTVKKERTKTIEAFKSGEIDVMVSVDVLREGFDATIAQCGIDLQPNFQLRTYWQKVGRVKRAHEGQDKAIWLDFAGNFWRFPHPDEDFDWSLICGDATTQSVLAERAGKKCGRCGSKNISRGRCQDCGNVTTPGKEPWSCAKCSYTLSPWERLTDGKCPNCQAPIGKATRKIRMKDGQMKLVGLQEKQKAKASVEQAAWDRCRYRAMYSGRTLSFARWMYIKEMGQEPPGDLKHCPDRDSGDWNRKVIDVYPWMDRRAAK